MKSRNGSLNCILTRLETSYKKEKYGKKVDWVFLREWKHKNRNTGMKKGVKVKP